MMLKIFILIILIISLISNTNAKFYVKKRDLDNTEIQVHTTRYESDDNVEEGWRVVTKKVDASDDGIYFNTAHNDRGYTLCYKTNILKDCFMVYPANDPTIVFYPNNIQIDGLYSFAFSPSMVYDFSTDEHHNWNTHNTPYCLNDDVY
ncbi:hypothetical protein CYY_000981 [Polysphondylium violaceum]|uniref:Carbohydrate binding domain-containing protein n=1 Tax=Polysphondylium violaceum TaxID=133409 RepID=A0A8J4Q2N6_9MYCE|nr:hypothetical protein CYY_000981 [Polysphondylium violaceum]